MILRINSIRVYVAARHGGRGDVLCAPLMPMMMLITPYTTGLGRTRAT